MSVLSLIVLIAALGVVTWLVTKYVPMPPGFARIIHVVAIVTAICLVLYAVGVDSCSVVYPGLP